VQPSNKNLGLYVLTLTLMSIALMNYTAQFFAIGISSIAANYKSVFPKIWHTKLMSGKMCCKA